MKAKLTSKGQITLPKKLRERLNLHKGDQVEFSINKNDEIVLTRPSKSITRLKGAVQYSGKPVILDEMEKAILEEGGKDDRT